MLGLVLLAESDPFNLRLMEELCDAAGIDLVTAGDGDTVLTVVARRRPALIVLDAGMRTVDGVEVLEVLVGDPTVAGVPILLTTDAGDEEARKRGLSMGAADYVTRPYRVAEVERRIRTWLRLAKAERAAARAEAQGADGPEGTPEQVGGHAQLRISLEYEATRALRYGHPLTCLVIVVTNLDRVVERNGAPAGLLEHLAARLRTSIRGIDHLFLSARDELTILLPETDGDAAEVVVDRLRRRATNGELGRAGIEPPPSFALGQSSLSGRGPATTGDALLAAARAALRPL